MDVRKATEAHRGRVGSGDVARLVRQLHDDRAVERDAAVARLRVIGSPAFASLCRLIQQSAATPVARAAALSSLEGLDDARAIGVARTAIDDADHSVALAAIGVLRGWVTHEQGLDAVEALTVAALDRARESTVRVAALDALSELPPHLVAPVRATSALEPTPPPTDDATRALDWLTTFDATASLSAVHELLSVAREGQRVARSERQRHDWARVRGVAHVALARRGSRLGLYDLRDAFDGAAAPLPLDFLTATARIGDDTCLEPLARAWAAASSEPWWQARVAETAAELVRRLDLSGRHTVVKRIRDRWPLFHACLGRSAAGKP